MVVALLNTSVRWQLNTWKECLSQVRWVDYAAQYQCICQKMQKMTAHSEGPLSACSLRFEMQLTITPCPDTLHVNVAGEVVLYTWASTLLEQPHLWEAPLVDEAPLKVVRETDWRQEAALARQAAEYAEAERQVQVCLPDLTLTLKRLCKCCVMIPFPRHNRPKP
jgi:hypothetical protein